MNETPPRSKWRRPLWIAAVFIIGTAGIGACFWTAAYSKARDELHAELQRMSDRGEPATFVECEPPPLAASENAAPLYLAAMAQLVDVSEEFQRLLPYDEARPTPGDYPAFSIALAGNQAALATLRQALKKPRCQFSYDYSSNPYSIHLEASQNLTEFSRLLQADVAQSLGNGNHQRAITAVDELLNLPRLLEDEPFFISRLVQHFAAWRGVNSLQDVLGRTDLTPAQFDAIDRRLARLHERAGLKHAVLNARAIYRTTIQAVGTPQFRIDIVDPYFQRVSPPGDETSFDRFVYRTKLEMINRGWGSTLYRPWMMRNETFLLRVLGEYSAIVDQSGPTGKVAMQRLEADTSAELPAYSVVELVLGKPPQGLDLTSIRRQGLWHRQQLIIARLALRAARYRGLHDKLPGSLNELVDAEFPQIPPDLFTGAALVYNPLPNGFVIYALDENGDDDGGLRPEDEQFMGARFQVEFREKLLDN